MPDPSPLEDGPPEPASPSRAVPDPWQQRLALLTADPGPRSRLVAGGAALAAAAATVAVVALLRGPTPPPPELELPMADAVPAPAETTTTTEAPDIVVHAAGAVVRPGVYRLEASDRVGDLLDAAGGAVAEADVDRVNLAAALEDGARVYVPRVDEAVPPVEMGTGGGTAPAAGGGGDAASDAPVDINTADGPALESLPGVGPATAAAILEERERRGRFATVEELLDVRGIGDAKLAALRDHVVVS